MIDRFIKEKRIRNRKEKELTRSGGGGIDGLLGLSSRDRSVAGWKFGLEETVVWIINNRILLRIVIISVVVSEF